LPHGIPSRETFERVFAAINPEALERCFEEWTRALAGSSRGQLVAIDGKTLHRSFHRVSNKAAIYSNWEMSV
ncbi:MAG: transposase family protein, partial [Gemmatimonadales bacterium]